MNNLINDWWFHEIKKIYKNSTGYTLKYRESYLTGANTQFPEFGDIEHCVFIPEYMLDDYKSVIEFDIKDSVEIVKVIKFGGEL